MSRESDPRRRDRRAQLLSHTALKYSGKVRRVASCLRTRDQLVDSTADPRGGARGAPSGRVSTPT
jgi:hypothetical protein